MKIGHNVNMHLLALFLHTMIELSSFFDLVSDLFIVVGLCDSRHAFWLTFCLMTIMAPYYTTYTSLIQHLITLIHSRIEKEERTWVTFFAHCLVILPTMLIILLLVDNLYICFQIVVLPVLFFLSIFEKG